MAALAALVAVAVLVASAGVGSASGAGRHTDNCVRSGHGRHDQQRADLRPERLWHQ